MFHLTYLMIFAMIFYLNDGNKTEFFNTTISTTTSENNVMLDNLRDIAYYLRAHKFNEYDRRYETDGFKAPRVYFKNFPRPPLRSLHWEVRQYCEPSFKECVEYLAKKLRQTALRRADDTAVVMQEQGWTVQHDWVMINPVENECLRLKIIDDKRADPFEGPLERFQWRVTASYYMCWYTMLETPQLEHLYENCDNFASCIDPTYFSNNHDPRANDSIPYGCARYSFCPDPCCPNKHLSRMHDCWNMPDNPCFRSNPAGQRKCTFNRTLNTDFSDMVLNRWNVSCRCQKKGFEWNSLYGICIDVDECGGPSPSHNCDRNSQACVNLAGGFRCACKWGNIWSKEEGKCVPSAALALIKLDRRDDFGREENKTQSFVKRIMGYFKRSKGNVPTWNYWTISTCTLFYLIENYF